mmetsp:Transcript_21985/g.65035  ORF Transcript_21985/g.65035 Transcript_21985/m.65035 type:complete len:247 (-) Transcript_21985:510-1250(-)
MPACCCCSSGFGSFAFRSRSTNRSRFFFSAASSFFVRVLIVGSAGIFRIDLPLVFIAFWIRVLIDPNDRESYCRGWMEVTSLPVSFFLSASPSVSFSSFPAMSNPPLTFLKSTNLCFPALYSGRYSSRLLRSINVESTLANVTSGYLFNKFDTASFTYGSGLPPFRSRPHMSLLRHLALRSLVFSIFCACGSSIPFSSLVSMWPVLRCFSGTCFGGPTFPLRKMLGRFFRSMPNLSATVLPLSGSS